MPPFISKMRGLILSLNLNMFIFSLKSQFQKDLKNTTLQLYVCMETVGVSIHTFITPWSHAGETSLTDL